MQTRVDGLGNGRWTTAQVAGAIGLLIATLSIAQSQEPAPTVRPAAQATDDETPIGPRWWPSNYGADDQRGAANLLTAEKVVEAARLIKQGKVFQLGRVYEREMPGHEKVEGSKRWGRKSVRMPGTKSPLFATASRACDRFEPQAVHR